MRGSYVMRCYFIRGGHIADVDKLTEFSDEEATAKAHALFSERRHFFEGFELWERARVLIRHPEPTAPNNVVAWPLHRGLRRAVASVRPGVSPSPPPKG